MDRQLLLSLMRHWTWAARERELFEYFLPRQYPGPKTDFQTASAFFATETGTALCLWLALLYATCDGLQCEANVAVSSIEPEYPAVAEQLRQFRNATFHVQPQYWSPKLVQLLQEPGSLSKIHAVHDALGRWLGEQLLTHQTVHDQSGS